MEATNVTSSSPKDRGRHRLLAVRPSTASSRATSGSSRHHRTPLPHSPRSPLYTDNFTLSAHPPGTYHPSSPPAPSFMSTTSSGTDRPPSPSPTTADVAGHFQYALSSAEGLSSGLQFNPALEQGWPRIDPDGAGDGAGVDEEDDHDPDEGLSLSPRQTRRRDSTKAASSSSSSSSRFFRSIVYKFGRTFNRNYFLPSDKQEQERMNLQHEISVEVHDGELHLCPVIKPRRVLDVGTGTGIWAVEFARRNPDSEVLGIDLNPVPPPIVPNCHFGVADVYDEWKYGGPFDFIHVRSLGEPTDKRKLFRLIYENLAPGGWVEFQEWILHAQSSDRSLDGTAFQKWNKLMSEGIKHLGKSLFYALDYKRTLEHTGFENIVERKYAVPTNTWPPGKQSQRIGAMQRANTLQIIDVFSWPVFSNGLGWSKDALDRLLIEVRKDIENTRIHSYSTLMTVYCKKPHSSTTSSLATAETPPRLPRPSMS
ncbi:S-adenosyl-L-methionine-dependent methyltransferase [Annulohypoxylon maeteangense]|uniref:S-adenosyl-L-methionine-dependent methyltransferase n=1 Tax=Annulohypoxylon maeteangense TaxID=1927788 RepID=UPI002007F755|nr:S-adenosyl-L-methionine-dependent methyltransferase [Annulohypoxylon maeteangense]KAI0888266.1 S-adenosyl-L-methionine-dependent methyltransferase [Annulohypoxylon maeteangense]